MHKSDPLDLQAEVSAARDAEYAREVAELLEADDVKWLMESERGRRIVYRWLDRARVFTLSFNESPIVMAFNEGVRNSGLGLLAQINAHCPEAYVSMMKEAHARGRRND